MNEKIQIREMIEADIPAVFELSQKCFTVPWSETSLRQELQNPVAYYMVAVAEGHIVGYGGLWSVLDEGEITNIAVETAYRRQGVGRAILEGLLQKAKEKALHIMHLEVRQSNVGAQKLYGQNGFKEIGIRKNYYQKPREDGIMMQYMLEESDT